MKPQWRLAELQHVLRCRECGQAIDMADMAWFVPPRPVEPGCVTLRPVVHRVCPVERASQALMFVTKNRDSSKTRPALADYLLLFRKPGDNQVPIKTDVSNDEWIDWAQPVWLDIKETNTLNVRAGREQADERHICPLQLDFIERCIRLWSNPGETVLTPFAGIGSEVWVARKLGRRGIGIELKPSYWRTAVDNLRRLDADLDTPALLDLDGCVVAS